MAVLLNREYEIKEIFQKTIESSKKFLKILNLSDDSFITTE